MSATDPPATSGLDDDHCLVHQFIRLHGRRPSPEELARLRNRSTPADPASRTRRAPMLAIRGGVGRFILGRDDT